MRSRRHLDDRAFASGAGSAGSRRRTARGGLLLAAIVLLAPGCQLNRSFFQMDSNSRVPFFGVDLAPSLPKRSSSVDGVSRLQSETAHRSRPPAATEQTAPPKSLTLPLSESVMTSTTAAEAPIETFR